MRVANLWRYPVKSMRGEPLETAVLTQDGIAGDRVVHVRGSRGVLTARTRPKLLGLAGTTGPDGEPLVDGHPWDDPLTAAAIREAAGADAHAVRSDRPEVDILPLLVATDGAVSALGHDHRRLRPNLLIGGVDGLAERDWPGQALRIGEVVIGVDSLRQRCVMTTWHPDTGEQDLDVLRRVNREFEGTIALDCWVARGGEVRVGDPVELLDPRRLSRPAGARGA